MKEVTGAKKAVSFMQSLTDKIWTPLPIPLASKIVNECHIFVFKSWALLYSGKNLSTASVDSPHYLAGVSVVSAGNDVIVSR